jgi:outer membrane murein-binding lipoprotein Lpp
LVDVTTGEIVLDDTAGSDAGIDVVSSDYATIAAEQRALENLAEEVADRIGHTARADAPRAPMNLGNEARAAGFHRPLRQAGARGKPILLVRPGRSGRARRGADAGGQLPEPGERIDLSGAELKADPARLGDEARSQSLFGGARHIFARVNGDDACEAVKILLETSEAGAGAACPVLIHAASATDRRAPPSCWSRVAMRWSRCSGRRTCAP